MSLVVAWKSGSRAFLIADTVVTASGGEGQGQDKTQFGQTYQIAPTKVVREGAMKLISIGGLIIGITADDFTIARSICQLIRDNLENKSFVENVIRRSIISNGPYESSHHVDMLFCWHDGTSIRLCRFVSESNNFFDVGNNGVVIIGSSPWYLKFIFENFITLFRSEFPGHNSLLSLLFGLGLVHSVGIRNNTLDSGFGGAHVGVIVEPDITMWQPDVLYILVDKGDQDPGMVTALCRDNVFMTRSTLTQRTVYFLDSISLEMNFSEWRKKWTELSEHEFRSGKVNFVVLLSRIHNIVTVVQMNKNLNSEDFRIDPVVDQNNNVQINISLSPRIQEMTFIPTPTIDVVSEPFKFNFMPYRSPPEIQ